MQSEPNKIALGVDLTTNAAAGTATQQTLIAAPGAGLRFRVFRIDITMQDGSPAGRAEVRARSGLSFYFGAMGFTGNQPSDHCDFGETGIAIGENTALILRDVATVAAMLYRATVNYKTETI